MEDDNKDKNNRRKIINFILIIIIIIIILLLSSCFNFGTINNYVPTGNIDIFDITIDKSCCKELEDCKCTCSDNKDDNNKEPIIYDDSNKKKEQEIIKEAKIFDNDVKKYNNSSNLNIFSNPAYEFRDIIAPLSTNVYQFVVRNSNEFSIKYEIFVDEENEYNINMKYKLKKNGNYIVGDSNNWVTYEELKIYNNDLLGNSKDVYQLEWKWFESSNDTYVGEVGKDYKLKISFDGEQI